jgi:hypothetical protein
MKKSNQITTGAPEEKGFLELAGEAMTVLGHEIVAGKDKLVEAAAEKITEVKKAIKKKIAKKKVVAPVRSKSVAVKKTVKKAAAKVAKKLPAKKVVKKKK